MKNTSADYEEMAKDALQGFTELAHPEVAATQVKIAQVWATLAQAAAIAEQTEVLKGLVVNGQLKVWGGVK